MGPASAFCSVSGLWHQRVTVTSFDGMGALEIGYERFSGQLSGLAPFL